MTLYDICKSIAEVEEGLAYGEIEFVYDNLMSAMKPGHPADILDDILSIIGFDVFKGKTPEREKIEEVYTLLKNFKDCFKVSELNLAIKSLEKYLYARIVLIFPIYIKGGRKSSVEYAVTDNMYRKIMKARDSGFPFKKYHDLEDLYAELMVAANNKLNDDIEFKFSHLDYVDFDYYIDYPQSMEGGNNE